MAGSELWQHGWWRNVQGVAAALCRCCRGSLCGTGQSVCCSAAVLVPRCSLVDAPMQLMLSAAHVIQNTPVLSGA